MVDDLGFLSLGYFGSFFHFGSLVELLIHNRGDWCGVSDCGLINR